MNHSLTLSANSEPASRPRTKAQRIARQHGMRIVQLVTLTALFSAVAVAAYALIRQDMYTCMEAIFLGFIPYILWSAHRRVGVLDFFAPDIGFPIAYVVFLFVGSIQLPLETQFGLVLPWIQWFYYIVGLTAYLIGVRLLPPPPSPIAASGAPRQFWSQNRFLIASMILFVTGFVARMVQIAKWGVEILHASDENARVVSASGILGVLALAMDAAFECFLLYLLVKKPRGPMRFFVITCMVLIAVNAVVTTNRSSLMRMMIAGLVILHYLRKRLRLGSILAFALFGFVFVALLGTFRDVSLGGDDFIRGMEQKGFTRQTYWLMNDYDVVRLPTEIFYMTTQAAPRITPYSYGTTSLSALAQFLPGHHPSPSEIVKNKLRLEFSGFGAASTMLAPLWFDGGIAGVIIGMFLFGFVARLLHQRLLYSANCVWLLVYGWFVVDAMDSIKDDILPNLGPPYVMVLFLTVALACGYPSKKITGNVARRDCLSDDGTSTSCNVLHEDR